MTESTFVTTFWQTNNEQIQQSLHEVFVWHALDNQGVLTSTRHANEVARQVSQITSEYISNTPPPYTDVQATIIALAERGLTITSAKALMQTVARIPTISSGETAWPATLLTELNEFQLFFMETVSHTRKLVQQTVARENATCLTTGFTQPT